MSKANGPYSPTAVLSYAHTRTTTTRFAGLLLTVLLCMLCFPPGAEAAEGQGALWQVERPSPPPVTHKCDRCGHNTSTLAAAAAGIAAAAVTAAEELDLAVCMSGRMLPVAWGL